MEEITEQPGKQGPSAGRIALWTLVMVFLFSGCVSAVVMASASDDPGQKRYEACAAEVDRQIPAATWKHSDSVPGDVNDAVDRTRMSVIGSCMEKLERSGH